MALKTRGHNVAKLDPLGILDADLDSETPRELLLRNYNLGTYVSSAYICWMTENTVHYVYPITLYIKTCMCSYANTCLFYLFPGVFYYIQQHFGKKHSVLLQSLNLTMNTNGSCCGYDGHFRYDRMFFVCYMFCQGRGEWDAYLLLVDTHYCS